MLDLAVHQDSGPISLADISERQGISLSYLEQLFSKMRRNDLVCSVRGPGGGYKLSRDSSDIFVAEIVDSVDEALDATRCGGTADCHDGSRCLTHDLWADLSVQIHQFLSEIDLASIIARGEVHQLSARQDAIQEQSEQFEILDSVGSGKL